MKPIIQKYMQRISLIESLLFNFHYTISPSYYFEVKLGHGKVNTGTFSTFNSSPIVVIKMFR